jgi:hypothetical protein
MIVTTLYRASEEVQTGMLLAPWIEGLGWPFQGCAAFTYRESRVISTRACPITIPPLQSLDSETLVDVDRTPASLQ